MGQGASISSTTFVTWTFAADGTVTHTSRTKTSGNTAGLGVVVGSDSPPTISQGLYATAGGTLTILWNNGEEDTYEYKVFLDHEGTSSLKLVRPGGKPKYYQ